MLPQVTFRGLSPSQEIIELVFRKARKLSEIEPTLRGCHVVIDATPRGSQRPTSYRVCVQLSGGTQAEDRSPRHATHANLNAAVGDAFRAARRLLDARQRHPRGPGALLRGVPLHEIAN